LPPPPSLPPPAASLPPTAHRCPCTARCCWPADCNPTLTCPQVKEGKFYTMMPRGTAPPANKKVMMTTTQDNQSAVDIVVILSENEQKTKGKVVGEFTLDGIPYAAAPRPRTRPCTPSPRTAAPVAQGGSSHRLARCAGRRSGVCRRSRSPLTSTRRTCCVCLPMICKAIAHARSPCRRRCASGEG
jgi:hypothetical protein